VLPFTNLSGDPAQNYLADGITESITTTLSKIPNLFVIFRHSTFTYKGKPVSVKQVAEELGVRYVLEGSVQRSGDKLRITAQLIDALTGHHLWAEEYDREFRDLFELQNDISQHVMIELEVKLTYGEEVRVPHRQTNNPQAYQYYMQGVELHRSFAKLEMAQSAELFKKAVALDPKFATAWVWLGWSYALRGRKGWIEGGRAEGYARAMELAQKALAIDASNVDAFALQAYVLGYREEYEKAITLLEKAVALNPNHVNNIALLARSLVVGGRPEKGLALMKKAMRLSPHYPVWYPVMLGRAHYILEEYDEAIAAFGRYHDRNPDGPDGLLQLAYAYAAAGQLDEAQAKVAELFKQYPAYTVKNYDLKKFRDPIVRERILNDLRKAGLK
jgi:adenylate cyclase